MSFITRRKSLDAAPLAQDLTTHKLRRTLSWPHLIALGVGAIVGTGIYTLIGIGAGMAGPGVMLSFVIAGAVCAFAALCYAEMATMLPQAGSAYTYAYHGVGEGFAWMVGWSLILEYTVVAAAVSAGWSGQVSSLITQWGWPIPHALLAPPGAGGIVNLPSILIAAGVTAVLLAGTRESATVNFILVLVKLAALAGFIALTLPVFDGAHFHPFMPFGFGATEGADGAKHGVMAAAALMFFAFYGFDAISTAAEETRNPSRDLTIGIVGSMLLCTAIYMLVAAAALGASPYDVFSRDGAPLAFILKTLNHPLAAALIAGAAVVALPTVIMVFMFGQTRIFFAMARDGLIPRALAAVGPRGVPTLVTLLTGAFAALIAGFVPLKQIAEVANAGTLLAFVATALCMLILRRVAPARPRAFRCPAPWLVGPLAILGCLYLFASLSRFTMIFFVGWNLAGFAVYLAYGRTASRLARDGGAA
ncbi:amino acid permease [Caulobacter sp. KR2-114]|uniref:amino acid permease n=1 Tax=Caulobacter sp. KR2-114 TaxID=3400912 RepID=UPI003C115544